MDSEKLVFYGFIKSPPCFLAQATMDHLGIEYEHKVVIPMKDTRTEWFKKKNPFGKVPFIEEGDFCLNESHAIARYVSTLILIFRLQRKWQTQISTHTTTQRK